MDQRLGQGSLSGAAATRGGRLALETAEAVDQRVEALSDELVAANVAAGRPINLLRAEHRREHLDEIELALGQRRPR